MNYSTDLNSPVPDGERRKSSFRKSFFNISSKIFSPLFRNSHSIFFENFQLELDKAEIGESSQEYVSGISLVSLLVGIIITALTLAIYFVNLHNVSLFLLIPLSVSIAVGLGYEIPLAESSVRRKKIDQNLGASFAFISAMSSADVPINLIILKLSKMKEFGEVRREALKIASLTELLGVDIFTAMKRVARVSPSVEWQRFLQGAVATSTAGARLSPYFIKKAADFQDTLRLSLKKNAESVSVFAEMYVTVGVAFPLFLIIILAVMAVIARNTSSGSLLFLLLFSFLVLPTMIASFVILISSVNGEVQVS